MGGEAIDPSVEFGLPSSTVGANGAWDARLVIRLVVTDLDGTFWDTDLAVPVAHLGAAAALADQGVEVLPSGVPTGVPTAG